MDLYFFGVSLSAIHRHEAGVLHSFLFHEGWIMDQIEVLLYFIKVHGVSYLHHCPSFAWHRALQIKQILIYIDSEDSQTWLDCNFTAHMPIHFLCFENSTWILSAPRWTQHSGCCWVTMRLRLSLESESFNSALKSMTHWPTHHIYEHSWSVMSGGHHVAHWK